MKDWPNIGREFVDESGSPIVLPGASDSTVTTVYEFPSPNYSKFLGQFVVWIVLSLCTIAFITYTARLPDRIPLALTVSLLMMALFFLPDFFLFRKLARISKAATVTVDRKHHQILVNTTTRQHRITYDALWSVTRVPYESDNGFFNSTLYYFLIETKNSELIYITSLMTEETRLDVGDKGLDFAHRHDAWRQTQGKKVLNLT